MLAAAKRVLQTGMPGTGKPSVIQTLAARGYKAIDADDGWCERCARDQAGRLPASWSREQGPPVHDPGGVEGILDPAQDLHAGPAKFGGQEG